MIMPTIALRMHPISLIGFLKKMVNSLRSKMLNMKRKLLTGLMISNPDFWMVRACMDC